MIVIANNSPSHSYWHNHSHSVGHIHVYVHIRVRVRIRVRNHVRVCVHVRVRVRVRVGVRVHVIVCVRVCVRITYGMIEFGFAFTCLVCANKRDIKYTFTWFTIEKNSFQLYYILLFIFLTVQKKYANIRPSPS